MFVVVSPVIKAVYPDSSLQYIKSPPANSGGSAASFKQSNAKTLSRRFDRLKVYGEGEWKVRKHGASKRRTWRKLHIMVDAQTQEVVAVEMTANFVGDSEVLPDLLEQLDEHDQVASVAADGAYDTIQCHQAIRNKGADALIPPREGAVEWPSDEDGRTHPRTAIVQRCAEIGRKAWKQESGYHQRSLAETAMFRIKTLFSGQLKNRTFAAQMVEAYLRVGAMNKMTGLGMPESYSVS
nr:IS5 family transposase [methane-oxidizing endosymbiont of Gigantopelta aegis]